MKSKTKQKRSLDFAMEKPDSKYTKCKTLNSRKITRCHVAVLLAAGLQNSFSRNLHSALFGTGHVNSIHEFRVKQNKDSDQKQIPELRQIL